MRFGGIIFLLANAANVGVLAMQQTGRLASSVQQGDKHFTTRPLGGHRGQGTWAQIDSQGSVGIAGQQPNPAAELATKVFSSKVEQQIDSQGSVGIAGQQPNPAAEVATKVFSSNVEQQIDSQGSVGIAGQQPKPAAEMATKALSSNVEQTSEGSNVRRMISKARARLHQSQKVLSDHSDAKPGPFVLPMWAQILCGSLTTIIIMGTFFCVKSRMNRDVPSNADSERLHVVLQETIERINALKEELEVHRREQQLVAAGEDPELAAARAEALDLQERTEGRAREIHEAASSLAEQRDQLVEGSQRVQDTFKEVIEGGRVRVEDFSKMQATGLYKQVEEAVADANVPAWVAPAWMTSTEEEDFLTLPPLVSLIQGALASRSIHLVSFSCTWKIVLDVTMLALSAVVFDKERHAACPDKKVWVWHVGLLAANSLDLLARVVVSRWCSVALESLTASRTDMENEGRRAGKSIFEQMDLLKQGSDSYFESFYKYNGIVGSWLYTFLEVITFFHLCWGFFGLWTSMVYIVEDSLSCTAKMALTYLHVYSFFFVMLLTWNVLTLILTVVGHLAGSRLVSGPILQGAKSFDDDTMKGIPLALTLVESFVLTNSAGSLSMSKREVKDDLRQLTADLELLDEQLMKKKRAAERVNEVAASVSTQEEYMNRYQDMMDQGFRQAKPLVGLIAANVRTADVANTGDHNAGMAERTAVIRMAVNARRQRRGLRRQHTDQEASSDNSDGNSEEADAQDADSF